MIIKSDELKQVCSKILSAVDSNEFNYMKHYINEEMFR